MKILTIFSSDKFDFLSRPEILSSSLKALKGSLHTDPLPYPQNSPASFVVEREQVSTPCPYPTQPLNWKLLYCEEDLPASVARSVPDKHYPFYDIGQCFHKVSYI